uniref:RNA helicase n=1 Tax=Zonotrichia albicollis TaxID=44394 RepID=A0A8D2M1J9_ZONAL
CVLCSLAQAEDPSCFWIAVREPVPGVVGETVYANLNAEMEQFYTSYKGTDEVKEEEIKKGQVYVVFSEELKCWCRALVQSVWCQADGYQFSCFLVDYAKYCYVPSKSIRVLPGAFAKIPHRAKKCRLHCTKPLTLHIDYCENTATEVKATIQTVEDKVLEVFLFVTIKDEKVRYFYIANTISELACNKFSGPTFTQSYCWPAAAGGCDVVAISHQGNDPLLYIPPVLTLLQENHYQALPNMSGPLALVLCPGWKKAQLVFDLLKTYRKGCRHLHPVLITLGQNKEAASQMEIRGCEVVVTTPYNLLRLLEHNTGFLCRLCHLVLDEIEVLFSDTSEQVFTILDFYKKATARPRGNLPHQIIAVGTQWNKHITPLIKEFMNDPHIVITLIEEAAIFGNVQQVVQPCISSSRTAELLKILDFTQRNLQKVLVFTDSVTEVEMIHKDSAVDQEDMKAKSVILLTENSSCHAPEIFYYLKHAEAEIPEELYDLTARVQESEEDEKFSRPLCASLKTFGICRNRTECPDRHQINLSVDMAQNIAAEMIETPERVTILPLFIVHATKYFGRIVRKQKDQYAAVAKDMNDYFRVPGHRISVNAVEKSVFYGLREGAVCHRVQVVETPAKDEENACKVTIKYIDEGRTSRVNSDQLLHLPVKFQSLPPQAVEIIVCRVKPIDNEVEWNPKVTEHINHKIKGKVHHAKVVQTLGRTVWVDPMVGVTHLPTMRMWVNEYNIRSEILSTGLGTDNPEHVGAILKLCTQMPVVDHGQNAESDSSHSVWQSGELNELSFSCHPPIKWFQDDVSVTLKVQILRATESRCEFCREKVTFSAYSEGKRYVADLELYQSVIAEKSTCVVKDTEAVILLVKEKKGTWCKLLKNKNVHVSLDFECWQESEDETPFTVGKDCMNLCL